MGESDDCIVRLAKKDGLITKWVCQSCNVHPKLTNPVINFIAGLSKCIYLNKVAVFKILTGKKCIFTQNEFYFIYRKMAIELYGRFR